MPTPTLQAAPAARSASTIRPENSSRAASYPARGVGARRLRTSRPSLSSTAISILVPPKSTPNRKAMIPSNEAQQFPARLHGWLHGGQFLVANRRQMALDFKALRIRRCPLPVWFHYDAELV